MSLSSRRKFKFTCQGGVGVAVLLWAAGLLPGARGAAGRLWREAGVPGFPGSGDWRVSAEGRLCLHCHCGGGFRVVPRTPWIGKKDCYFPRPPPCLPTPHFGKYRPSPQEAGVCPKGQGDTIHSEWHH